MVTTTNAPATATEIDGFKAVTMPVTKLDSATKTRVPVGEVTIFVPLLSSMGIDAPLEIDADKKPVYDEEGLPVYAEDKHAFIFQAVYAAVKSMARNRLEAGTATVKAGSIIPSNWTQLTADVIRTGGAGLALYQECKVLFANWVKAQGKSAQATAIITGLFNNKKALEATDKTSKDKMVKYIGDFAGTLDADQLGKYSGILEGILSTAQADAVSADDF
jgi:hypothetical protein